MVTDHDIYFFDLQGYLLLKGALSADEVGAINAILDTAPPLKPGERWGNVQAHWYNDNDGLNLQHIYEAGEPFEKLIDHPSWYEHAKYFVDAQGSFDSLHGPLYIDENFANFRAPGEAIGMHSGGHIGTIRCQFRVLNAKFHCGQINILTALSDIGPGDGGTLIIPGSHNSNFEHPEMASYVMHSNKSGQTPQGAVEVHMNAGDALLFVDALCHGSTQRTNPGTRRVVVYRYGPSWGRSRHDYEPSPELLDRLTPLRRQMVNPIVPKPAI